VKILVINYYYEPYVGAHAYRWTQIAKVWAAAGHDVDVIAGRTEDCTREVREGVNIERVGIIRRQSNEKQIVSENPLRKQRIGFAKLIETLKKVYRFFFWPDGLWHWLPFLLVSLYRRRKNNYDLVISYSPTFSAHIGAACLKLFKANKLFWVADYGDPFSISYSMPPNNFLIYRLINNYAESKVIKLANKIVFTNESTYEGYRSCFGAAVDEKGKVIPHAVSIEEFYHCAKKENKNFKHIVYVGAFHKNIREPKVMVDFFNALGQDLNIEVCIYGPLNGIHISEVNRGCVKYCGVVLRDDAIHIIRNADLLVNVENSDCVMTPSKVVEYVATGLPIINFYADKVTALLNHPAVSDRVLNVNAIDEVMAAVEFIKMSDLNSVSLDQVKAGLSDFSLSEVADQYMDCARG